MTVHNVYLNPTVRLPSNKGNIYPSMELSQDNHQHQDIHIHKYIPRSTFLQRNSRYRPANNTEAFSATQNRNWQT